VRPGGAGGGKKRPSCFCVVCERLRYDWYEGLSSNYRRGGGEEERGGKRRREEGGGDDLGGQHHGCHGYGMEHRGGGEEHKQEFENNSEMYGEGDRGVRELNEQKCLGVGSAEGDVS